MKRNSLSEAFKVFEASRTLQQMANDKYYKDYKYGDPAPAAKNLAKAVDRFVKTAQKELNRAGNALSPGMKVTLIDELTTKLKKLSTK